MGKCPKCKRKIDKLCNWVSGESKKYMVLNDEGELEETFGGLDFEQDDKTNDYECPFCSEVIAKTEEKAVKILKE